MVQKTFSHCASSTCSRERPEGAVYCNQCAQEMGLTPMPSFTQPGDQPAPAPAPAAPPVESTLRACQQEGMDAVCEHVPLPPKQNSCAYPNCSMSIPGDQVFCEKCRLVSGCGPAPSKRGDSQPESTRLKEAKISKVFRQRRLRRLFDLTHCVLDTVKEIRTALFERATISRDRRIVPPDNMSLADSVLWLEKQIQSGARIEIQCTGRFDMHGTEMVQIRHYGCDPESHRPTGWHESESSSFLDSVRWLRLGLEGKEGIPF